MRYIQDELYNTTEIYVHNSIISCTMQYDLGCSDDLRGISGLKFHYLIQ